MNTGADKRSPTKQTATASQSPYKSPLQGESSIFDYEEDSPTKRPRFSNPSSKSKRGLRTPQKTPDSSPPIQTPKTPRQASSLGVTSGTAKTLLKYASRLKPLVLMLYEAFRMAVERKEVPSQEDFVGILDELADSLVCFSALMLASFDVG